MQLLSSSGPVEMRKFLNPNSPVLSIASTEVVSVKQSSPVFEALETMLSKGIRRLPVTDSMGRLTGMVSQTDVLNSLGGGSKTNLMRKGLDTTVRMIMSHPRSIHRTHTVRKALNDFRESGMGILPVRDEEIPSAVVSEFDFAVRVSSRTGLKSGQVMTRRPITARHDWPVREVARMLIIGPYRRLPIVQDGMLVGIVTPHDILSYLYSNRKLGKLVKEKSPVRDAMNRKVSVVHPNDDISVAASRMKNREIGGLPVVDELELSGVITKNDIMNCLAC